MKATGVVRRIDELGRIVIPKEIRKNLRIRDGESIEIYTDNLNQIILKKYSLSEDYNLIIRSYIDSIYQTIKKDVYITDRDKFISVSGSNQKKYENKDISNFLSEIIINRDYVKSDATEKIELVNGITENCYYLISSIISNGECIGLLVITSETEEINNSDEKIIQIASQFLGKYIEN